MRYFRLSCIIILLFSLLPMQMFTVEAAGNDVEIIYFDDNSYITVSLSVWETRAGGKSASKTYTYTNSFGAQQWTATLYATFEFDGTEYLTTDCSINVNIQNSNWYVISKSASMSGCGATGEVTMGRKTLGVTIDTKSATITLSCSPHGTIS